jgi:hypothetical protein
MNVQQRRTDGYRLDDDCNTRYSNGWAYLY